MSINSVVHVLYGMHDLIINFNKVTTLLLKLLSENEIRKEFMMLNTEFKPCVFCCWWHIENICILQTTGFPCLSYNQHKVLYDHADIAMLELFWLCCHLSFSLFYM